MLETLAAMKLGLIREGNMFLTTREERKQIRESLNIHRYWSIPVVVVEGDFSPKRKGCSYHYQTKGGTTIYYPSAYSKTGWSNMVYVSSTNRIIVGLDWVIKNLRTKKVCKKCNND